MVSELVLLGREVSARVVGDGDLERYRLGDGQTIALSPTNFRGIYKAADAVLSALWKSKGPGYQYTFHLSPGTPSMAAVWILLAMFVPIAVMSWMMLDSTAVSRYALAYLPLYSILAAKAQKANIAFSPKQLMLMMVAVSIFAFLALTVATGAALPVRAGLAVGMGVGGIYMWVNNKAKKRMSLLEEQLPDAVELMVRSLRVGHPFASAIGIVAKEVGDPLGTEFGFIADEAAYGRDVSESLKAFAERMDNQDLRFLAVAVTIQQT